MLRKIKLLWTVIKESLWFIPALMVAGAILIAFLFIELDSNISYGDLPFDWFLYSGNKEGARSVLSTIASSMATIAGVTFSMTLVALTMASSQYGPRLLRNFVTDKGNQMVLGSFIATFLYALIVLLTIKESDDDEFVPKLSVVFGFLLSIFSLGVLIYFIHHIASSIAAENVIKSSFLELETAVKRFMKDEPSADTNLDAEKLRAELTSSSQSRWPITFDQSGYIEMIDYNGLYHWACAHDLVLELCFHPGDFYIIHQPFAYCYSRQNHRVKDTINGFVTLGNRRTPKQDIDFSIKQIVEVAVRALSPGINDPHTAIACIHWLGAALVMISKKHFPEILVKEKDNVLRIIKKDFTYSAIVDTCFDQLRLYAKTNILVTVEMLKIIRMVLLQSKILQLNEALVKKAATIYELVDVETLSQEDRLNLLGTYEGVKVGFKLV